MFDFITKQTMKQITKFLKKAFGFRKLNMKLISHFLLKCAKSHSYIETLGKHADSLHLWIKSIYEIDLKQAFEQQVRYAIKLLRIKRAQLAFDITHEPFYGKTRNLHIINTSKEKKYGGEFHFITCCIINKGKQIPIMALPVRIGEQVKLTIELLRYCSSLFKNISYCLFDRGFYVAELIDFLTVNRIKYLILVPKKKGVLTKYIENTKHLGYFSHRLKYKKDKSVWKPVTQITVCKGILDYDWIFATNIKFDQAIDYVLLYKRRWQIETNYRVEDEAKIKSKSSNYMIRYFYFLVGLLLHLFWIVHKNQYFYVQFKKYIDLIEHRLLLDFLEISKFYDSR